MLAQSYGVGLRPYVAVLAVARHLVAAADGVIAHMFGAWGRPVVRGQPLLRVAGAARAAEVAIRAADAGRAAASADTVPGSSAPAPTGPGATVSIDQ